MAKKTQLLFLISSLFSCSAGFGASQYQSPESQKENAMAQKFKRPLVADNSPITPLHNPCPGVTPGLPPIFTPSGVLPPLIPPNRGGLGMDQFMALISTAGIELSDEQLEIFAQSKSNFMDRNAPVIFRVHSLERQLRHALVMDEIDTGKIAEISKQLSAQRQLLDDYSTEQIANLSKLLTAQQRRKMKLSMDKQEAMSGSSGPLPPPPFFLAL